MLLSRLAPAKVNLYLHVAAPDARGYHPLQSLVVFADIGDTVTLEAAGEGEGTSLSIDGFFGHGLSAGADNLVLRAVAAFEDATGVKADVRLHLDKALPIASGIGGGSADAGAALHLLRQHLAPSLSDDSLSAMAEQTGADGVMCLWAKASVAEGYGEKLTPARVPVIDAVLINPGVACPTPAVFRAYDEDGLFLPAQAEGFDGITDVAHLVAALRATRNDLQAAAVRLQPVIGDVVDCLDAQPETLLARMSGSGATCFALCTGAEAAKTLSRRLETLWPGAWVRACRLG